LERKHQQTIQQYEDEIIKLRRQIGKTDSVDLSSKRSGRSMSYSLPPLSSFSPITPPTTGSSGGGGGQTNGNLGSNKKSTGFFLESDKTEETVQGNDWFVGYNPNVPRALSIDLSHDKNHNSVVCSVKFSKNGKYLATGSNQKAQIYDVNNGDLIHVFHDKSITENLNLYIRSVSFSPDGKNLAAGAEDKIIRIWDIESETIIQSVMGHEQEIFYLDYTPDGRMIVTGSGDKTVKIWNSEDLKCISTLGDSKLGPLDSITSIAVSPNGSYIAAGSLDKLVRVWELETGQLLHQLEGHIDSVYSVCFSPDSKSLASGSLDKTLRHWNISDGTCSQVLSGHRDYVLSVVYSPDGNWLVSGSKDRTVYFWDYRNGIPNMILQGHRNSVISVDITENDGNFGKFATGSGDHKARIWDWKTIKSL